VHQNCAGQFARRDLARPLHGRCKAPLHEIGKAPLVGDALPLLADSSPVHCPGYSTWLLQQLGDFLLHAVGLRQG
jgi:hypothetical protein